MRSPLLLMLLLISLAPSLLAQRKGASQKPEYVSPDGELVAAILPAGLKPRQGESRVEVRTRTGKILTKSDYSSEDGEHGYGVDDAVWTPDSKFFVYSLDNVGGHSPWHTPVQFFSREKNKIFSLDDLLNDAISDPRFAVVAPDKVTVRLCFKDRAQTISLSSLIR